MAHDHNYARIETIQKIEQSIVRWSKNKGDNNQRYAVPKSAKPNAHLREKFQET